MKRILFILLVLFLIPIVNAVGSNTTLGFAGSILDVTTGNYTKGDTNITVNISTSASCSSNVIYSEKFVNNVSGGVFSLLAGYYAEPLNLEYGREYWSCYEITNGTFTEVFGADPFTSGKGLIEQSDINLTDMSYFWPLNNTQNQFATFESGLNISDKNVSMWQDETGFHIQTYSGASDYGDIILDPQGQDLHTDNIVPLGPVATRQLGTSSNDWLGIWLRSIWFDDTNTVITEDASHNLTFTDAVAGTWTLLQLSSWIGIATSDLNMMGFNIINTSDPTNPQDVATKNYVDNAVSSTAFDFFFLNQSSDIANHFNMSEGDLGLPESTLDSASLGAGTFSIFNFTSIQGQPEFNELRQGVYDVHTHLYKTGTKPVTITPKLYNISSDGSVRDLLITFETSAPLTTSSMTYNLHGILVNATMLPSGNRLNLELEATIGATGSNVVITSTQEGTTDSHLTVETSSSAFDAIFLRQDGTKSLTGDWDYGIYDITGTGNIGIGLTNPLQRLHVNSSVVLFDNSIAGSTDVRIQTLANSDRLLTFREGATKQWEIRSDNFLSPLLEPLVFNSNGANNVLILHQGGGISVNTTSKVNTVNIGGDLNATGIIYTNSTERVCTGENGLCNQSTKEFFVPVVYGTGTEGTTGDFYRWNLAVQSSQTAHMNFYVPQDVTSVTNAVVIIIVGGAGGGLQITADIQTDFGAQSETYNTHSTATGAIGIPGLTAGDIVELPIITTNMAAGDYVGVQVVESGLALFDVDFDVIGVRFKYN